MRFPISRAAWTHRALAFGFAATCMPVRSASAQKPPTAESILSRHEAAIGGAAALDKHSSIRMTGTVELPSAAIKGTIEILRTKTNKFVQKMVLTEVGTVMKGYDGAVSWVVEPTGPALLTGADADVVKSQADWHHAFRAPIAANGARVDSAEFEGQHVWRLTYAGDVGMEVMTYFSRATGMRVGETWTTGIGETTLIEGDYKSFGGVQMPTKITSRAPVGVMVITITSVEFDHVTPAQVAPPPEVRALIKRD